jgi:hypothetical protein
MRSRAGVTPSPGGEHRLLGGEHLLRRRGEAERGLAQAAEGVRRRPGLARGALHAAQMHPDQRHRSPRALHLRRRAGGEVGLQGDARLRHRAVEGLPAGPHLLPLLGGDVEFQRADRALHPHLVFRGQREEPAVAPFE